MHTKYNLMEHIKVRVCVCRGEIPGLYIYIYIYLARRYLDAVVYPIGVGRSFGLGGGGGGGGGNNNYQSVRGL